jgi:hypothetical protein
MTRTAGIDNILGQMRDRRFTFVEYRQGREFRCFMCHDSGLNSYVLQDENRERIAVGEDCFRDNFLILPREVT